MLENQQVHRVSLPPHTFKDNQKPKESFDSFWILKEGRENNEKRGREKREEKGEGTKRKGGEGDREKGGGHKERRGGGDREGGKESKKERELTQFIHLGIIPSMATSCPT